MLQYSDIIRRVIDAERALGDVIFLTKEDTTLHTKVVFLYEELGRFHKCVQTQEADEDPDRE